MNAKSERGKEKMIENCLNNTIIHFYYHTFAIIIYQFVSVLNIFVL